MILWISFRLNIPHTHFRHIDSNSLSHTVVHSRFSIKMPSCRLLYQSILPVQNTNRSPVSWIHGDSSGCIKPDQVNCCIYCSGCVYSSFLAFLQPTYQPFFPLFVCRSRLLLPWMLLAGASKANNDDSAVATKYGQDYSISSGRAQFLSSIGAIPAASIFVVDVESDIICCCFVHKLINFCGICYFIICSRPEQASADGSEADGCSRIVCM